MKAETEVIKSLSKGDSEQLKKSCETLYSKYSNLVFHISYDILNNKEDAEDVVSDTFVSLFNKLNALKDINNIKYYLINTARYLSYERKRKTEKILEYNDDVISLNFSFASDIDYSKLMDKFSSFLTKEEIEIIVLHIEYDMKFREISKIKHKSIFSISSKYKRAIDKVRDHLKGEGNNYEKR